MSVLSKVTWVATIGSSIDWYDFLLAATLAVIVWPSVFFSGSTSPSVALALSVAVAGVSWLSRPIGGYIFGYYGDKLGRKNVLVWTLITMGISSLAIALLPGYSAIGVIAPVLLILFRLVQGIGAGGEWGGAIAWVAEHAHKSKWRGLYGSFMYSVADIGAFVSLIAVIIAQLLLSHTAFVAWGWRAIMLIGVAVITSGAVIRYRFAESPLFDTIKKQKDTLKNPAVEAFKKDWKKIIVCAFIEHYTAIVPISIIIIFVQGYLIQAGVNSVAVSTSTMLAFLVGTIFVTFGGALSDKIGRKRVSLIGAGVTALMLLPYYFMVNTISWPLIIIAQVLMGAAMSFGAGGMPAWFSENFPTKYRYTGVGMSFQIANFMSGFLTAFIIPIIIVASPTTSFLNIIILNAVFVIAGFIASFMLKDDFRKNLAI